MPVDEFEPGSKYTGQQYQDWLTKRRLMKADPPSEPRPRLRIDLPSSSKGQTGNRYSGGESHGAGGGLVETLLEALAESAGGIVEKVPPLRQLAHLGECGREVSRMLKGVFLVIGALIAGGTAAHYGAQGGSVVVAACAGGSVEWILLPLLGTAPTVSVYLVGVAIVLALVSTAGVAIYMVIKWLVS
jgi:hypothetical protein